jgi:hypothetical protein
VFTWITIDPNLANRALVGSTIFRVHEAIIDMRLKCPKPLMLPVMMVFDATSRPIEQGAKPSGLRRLGHDAYVLRQAAVANHDPGSSISSISAVFALRGAIFYPK